MYLRYRAFLAHSSPQLSKAMRRKAPKEHSTVVNTSVHRRDTLRRQGQAQVKFDQGLVIDYGARCLYQDGQPVHLAKKEFDIVELLSMHPSQVFGRERIYESVWGWDSEGDSSVVAEHIRRIRAKLTAAG